uniref:Uncharacterized protein n=1 Tax=Anguilla anguilla TaxID=7936 RepID=A0A0E9PNP9_ANGAN
MICNTKFYYLYCLNLSIQELNKYY